MILVAMTGNLDIGLVVHALTLDVAYIGVQNPVFL